MTKTQLFREYESFISMHVNPPSFEEWLKQKENEPYYEKLDYLLDNGYENSTRGWTSDFE